MSISRKLTLSLRPWGRRGLVGALIAVAAPAMAPATAQAVPLTITVAMPASVTVDQTGLTARITLTNTGVQNASPRICNLGECSGAEGLIFIPSCGSPSAAFQCATPELGVFSFAPTASPVAGSCGASPLMTSLDVVGPEGAAGKLRLVPKAGPEIVQLVLGPAGSATAACEIVLTFGVLKVPDTDAGKEPGVQTLQSVSATTVTTIPGAGIAVGTDTGTTQTTVVPRPVVTPPPPPPPIQPPPVVPPPVVPPPVVPPPVVPPPPPVQPSDLDHFKCYEALQPNFRQRTVGTRDQFGQRRARVLRTRQLCNPVSKNGARILQQRAHLVCYETRDTGNPTPPRTVLVTNQFGQRKLKTGRPNRLCVPSLKRRTGAVPATPDPTRLVDHFRCYDVDQQPAPRTVKLADQFGTTSTKVVRVIRLCNPVRKNNEPVRRAKSHLVCYSISDEQTFRPLAVAVRNQFGRAALRIRRPETLCLPSFKQVVQTEAVSAAPPGLDHFKCYEAEQPQFPPRFVGLRDQFGQSEGRVIATRQLCNPVSKNAGRVLNRTAHLVCYETPDVGTVPFQPRDVRVSNQFGIRQLSVEKPATLCVPSLKRRGAGAAPTGANPTLVLDHFRCYDVKPQVVARTVKLADQFKTSKTKVLRVVRLCNPVRKNNEGVRRPQAHLVCYSISEATFQPLAVTVRNQFGVAALRVRRPQMLCLPSLKRLVTAAGAEIMAANPA